MTESRAAPATNNIAPEPAPRKLRRVPGVVFANHRACGSWPAIRSLTQRAELPSGTTPRVDVFDQECTIVVKAELPGIAKEDVSVAVEDGDLVIQGKGKDDYCRMERSPCSFCRWLPLPDGVRVDAITATFSGGVLEIRIPKSSAAPHRSVSIPVS